MAAPQAHPAPVVFVVDDEPLLLALMARTLRDYGCSVLAACHGAAALQQLEALGRPVELLITDVQMPGLSGDVLAGLALDRGLARRVLFVSGFARHRTPLEQLGPVLAKPFSPAQFCDLIGSLLSAPGSRGSATTGVRLA